MSMKRPANELVDKKTSTSLMLCDAGRRWGRKGDENTAQRDWEISWKSQMHVVGFAKYYESSIKSGLKKGPSGQGVTARQGFSKWPPRCGGDVIHY